MSVSRLISLPVHAAIEMTAGLALMAAPFVLSFGAAGMVTAVIVGAAVVGLALSASSGVEGRGTLPSSAHAAYDVGVAIGLLLAGIALGLAGDPRALVVFALVGLTELVLSLNTRYGLKRA